jgi:hypothetical protein
MKKQIIMLTILVSTILGLTSCDDNIQEISHSVRVDSVIVPGKNGRILSITSRKYYLEEKQNEVRPKLDYRCKD